MLDTDALADPAVRARSSGPATSPSGLGDMDASLYLLFKAIREHSTVALSGESADEVFGGYKQFFDPKAQQADTFPWLVQFAEHFGDDEQHLHPGVTAALDLDGYVQDCVRRGGVRDRPAGRRDPTSSGGCARSATCT